MCYVPCTRHLLSRPKKAHALHTEVDNFLVIFIPLSFPFSTIFIYFNFYIRFLCHSFQFGFLEMGRLELLCSKCDIGCFIFTPFPNISYHRCGWLSSTAGRGQSWAVPASLDWSKGCIGMLPEEWARGKKEIHWGGSNKILLQYQQKGFQKITCHLFCVK